MFFGTWTVSEILLSLSFFGIAFLMLAGGANIESKKDVKWRFFKKQSFNLLYMSSALIACVFLFGGWKYDFYLEANTLNEFAYIPHDKIQILTPEELSIIKSTYNINLKENTTIVIAKSPPHTNFPDMLLAFFLGVIASVFANKLSNKSMKA